MPRKQLQLINGEIYHISDRAVGDSVIFKNENDYFRGIFSLYEFNNAKPVEIRLRRQQRKKEKLLEKSNSNIVYGGPTPVNLPLERDMFVEVLAFCFMPNHFHLILRQLKENGISKFMQKIGGYSTYFNEKYNRKGHLFNRFKAVHIKTDEQLRMAFIYVHTNPVSLVQPGWKENGIKDKRKAIKFLREEYRWSSFFDFIGKKNFPSVIMKDFFFNNIGEEKKCSQAVIDWIKSKKISNNKITGVRPQ